MPIKKSKGPKFAFKLLLVGEPEVGKTSLIKRYVDNFFKEGYQITLGVDFLSKTVNITHPKTGKETELSFQIWDVAGQSGFTNFRHLYLKKAHGVFLVFDLTRSDITYDKLDRWKDDVREQSPGAKIIVIGNKEDIAKESAPEEKEDLLKRFDAKEFFTTSAKTGAKVQEAFELMGRLILEE
ncbi:MAG: GTP-binding protein [Candidatus Heimdallarchaeota archaeon]|nr:GTP-binding protein [Candidatus Heimdallarchaeota archaeon]